MARRKKRRTDAAAGDGLARVAQLERRGVDVTADERHRLAECCAFFRASLFRAVAPGSIRHDDVEKLEAEIDALVRRAGNAPGRTPD